MNEPFHRWDHGPKGWYCPTCAAPKDACADLRGDPYVGAVEPPPVNWKRIARARMDRAGR